MYFSNSQPSRDLPIPATPITDISWARRSSAAAWKSSLTSRSSRSRPTNGGSSPAEFNAAPRGHATPKGHLRGNPRLLPLAPARRRDAQGSPEGHSLGLALEHVLARVLVRDGRLRAAPRPLADEHGP